MEPGAWLWCARAAWALLPVTTGTLVADAIGGWDTGPARLAAVAAWAAWAAGLLACLAPRPWGTTLLRVVAPVVVVVSCVAIPSAGFAAAAVGASGAIVAAALALSGPVNAAAANARAYGDEIRFPIRIPTPLFAGPVPLAVAVTAAGVAAGPYALASGAIVAGVVGTVVGLPAAFVAVRALHALAERWLVVVPAGVTVVDPLTLVDPVLMQRNAISEVGPAATRDLGPAGLDLRLGSVAGGVRIVLCREVLFGRRRGRVDAELVAPASVAVAVVGRRRFLGLAATQHLAAG